MRRPCLNCGIDVILARRDSDARWGPFDLDGRDHRETCAGLTRDFRRSIEDANREDQTRRFLAAHPHSEWRGKAAPNDKPAAKGQTSKSAAKAARRERALKAKADRWREKYRAKQQRRAAQSAAPDPSSNQDDPPWEI